MPLDRRRIAGLVKELGQIEAAVTALRRSVDGHRNLLDGLDAPVDANAYLRASLGVKKGAAAFMGDLDELADAVAADAPGDDLPPLAVSPAALRDIRRRMERSLREVAMGLSRLTGHRNAKIGGPGEVLGAGSPATELLAEVRRVLELLAQVGKKVRGAL